MQTENLSIRTISRPVFYRLLVVLSLVFTILSMTACHSPRRTTGTVLNDQTLEHQVIRRIHNHPSFGEADHIKVEVHQGVVLLAGETASEQNSVLASQLAGESRLTKRVVNDLKVGERAGFGGKLDNTWLTSKVNSILITENLLPGNDASRIKVISSQNTVYLMGMVSHAEGDAVAEVVRNIRGVEKVVKIFDYTD